MPSSRYRILSESKRAATIVIILCAILVVLIYVVLFFFSRLDEILYSPIKTPEEWCEIQPCVEINIFGNKIIIVQPTSTFFVYFLGFITLFIGLYFIRIRNDQKSRLWWGIALLLWGLGALFAGTSYQAFSYEIKCAGRHYCVWTSWWEIIYLILSVGSINALNIAQSYSCTSEKRRRIISIYSLIVFIMYVIIVLIGAIIPVQFLVSFEFMLIFFAPNVLIFFILNVWRYYKNRNRMDLVLIIIWISLGIITFIYYLYFILDITQILWDRGIWFSENDVLHIGLIIWMVYIRLILPRHLVDLSSER
jgi:hypothetical protein